MLSDTCNRTEAGKRQAGFTLIELLITVVIAGILAAIAFPSYIQYVTKTQRGIGKSSLVQVMDRQTQYFADNKGFATDITNLGFAENGFGVDRKGKIIAKDSSDRIYIVQLAAGATTTAFTLEAVPQLQQASRDSECGTLRITHTGVKSVSGTSADCW
jgi:type IV pilus assembly protein PilE